ncbi:MAG: 30S ribosomal protein S12 methylthiotransferase RimO [Ectothiorhodospiraceae bacterium]|nr:30S ribosomal protein S12 methylthiotransferase RimO [Ectothiorhodospiraceae bacterium]
MHTVQDIDQEKISIITLGCSKNIVDSEVLMRQISAHNLALVDEPSDADVLIINTCGFIDAAKEESVNTILEAAEMKRSGAIKKLLVAGCLSERYSDDLKDEIPEVDRFFGVTDFANILREFGVDFKKELLGERSLTTPAHYAYLKISEGCDNPCSFCAIPIMRGGHVSQPIEALVHEAKHLAMQGVKELVVIGQDTTYYGWDIYNDRKLARLLEELSDVEGIDWIRLMYAFPSHFPRDVIDVIRDRPNICKYLDMPIQHVDDKVLKSMRRGITRRATEELIAEIRDRIPEIALRTTLIVGYPNETEAAFETLYRFVEETKFDRLGVFTYSVEDDTTAAILSDTVSAEEKEERKNAILDLQSGISQEKNEAKIGQTLKVLFDRIEGDYAVGRTEFDTPEVDNEVLVPLSAFNNDPVAGTFRHITISEAQEYDLIGIPHETT